MRVIVAEDNLFAREGIVKVLEDCGVEVVAQTGDAEGLLREATTLRPDVVVVDIRMPPTRTDEGLVAAQKLRSVVPGTGVLVLSQYVEPSYALRLLEDHVTGSGYLLKDRVFDGAVMLDALRRITEGETVVDPTIVARLFHRPRTDDPVARLSEREREVLGLVAEGLSNKAIAERLFVSERTVEAHITSLFAKLELSESAGTHRRVLAVLAYLRR
jgi:DNA-binding NarL/FixJ family response regulator